MIQTLLNNPRTTVAAVVFAAAKLGSTLGGIWFPAHKPQFDATADAIGSAAIALGLLMAGDANSSVTKAEADTTFVKKQ